MNARVSQEAAHALSVSLGPSLFCYKSLTQIKNVFTCSKHSNLENGQSSFFSNVFFFTKCPPFLLKIGKDFNIDD